MAFKIKAVDNESLQTMLADQPQRGRTSKGGELIEEFLAGGHTAATVHLGSTKERNAIAISASNFARRTGKQVWIRKLGGGTGTDLLLIDLTKADAATKRAYEERPRVGRKPSRR